MKKDTVYGWIIRQRGQITRKEKNEALRNAKFAALRQCEDWLFALTRAQMRAPVKKRREDITTEGLPLLTKQKKDPTSLSELETTYLKKLVASDEIYELFENKITPTARRTERDIEIRQREQARWVTARQREKER